MDTRKYLSCAIIASLLATAGCATSPEEEQRRKDMEADIDDILSLELDPTEFGEPRNCLPNMEYKSFRMLGKRHLLFEGRQGRLWVNVLRGRCAGFDDDTVFIMRPSSSSRLCDSDWFQVVHRHDALSQAGMAPTCILGEFKPVTAAQVKEIEHRLEMR